MYPSDVQLSVIVVSYNTRDLLRECLASLDSNHELIVVDNASSDGSAAMVKQEFPRVRIVDAGRNMGFGAANNLGMASASGEVILLLNSDARAKPGAIEELLRRFADRDVVACGGRLEYPDGRFQWSACGPLTLWAVFCEQLYLEKLIGTYWVASSQTIEVAQVMGACLMMRPREKFDEDFFLYCEDTELCYRLAKHGKILYVPAAEFVHDLGSSSSARRWEAIARYNRGKELFFAKTRGPIALGICWVLNRIGALLRLAVWFAALCLTLFSNERLRQKCGLFLRVLVAPIRGPQLPPDAKASE